MPPDPPLAVEHEASLLDAGARARLRTLTRENAETVARHLVAAGLLMEEEPETAYLHAHAAQRRAGRVDVVREAVGLTAYATGRFAEALRELRTSRRLGGQDLHRAIEADCERALGRPERALALADDAQSSALSPVEQVELAIVVSGARLDLGEPDAALATLDKRARSVSEPDLAARVASARADVLEALGRFDEAARVRAEAGIDEEVLVLDAEEDDEEPGSEPREAVSGSEPGEAVSGSEAGEGVSGSEAGEGDLVQADPGADVAGSPEDPGAVESRPDDAPAESIEEDQP